MDDAVRTDQIEEVVTPVLRDHGLELVDVEWRPLRPGGGLRLFGDKPGGVGIRDCERVSREIGDVLDASAIIEASYDLEVSSPGLDRLLRKERELCWAVGKRVSCWLAGGREVRGRLGAVQAGPVRLQARRERGGVPPARGPEAPPGAENPRAPPAEELSAAPGP